MAVSFTTEQKLIFYLAQNIARLEPSFDAFKISRILVECGVFKENPLLVGERSKEATFVLLKHLFEMLSSRNDARAQQFRIFRLAVGEAGNREILEECLPDLGCSEEELDAHVLRLKDRNDEVAKWLTPFTAFDGLLDSRSTVARTPTVAERSKGREERSLNETNHVPSSYECLLMKFAFEEVHIYWKQMGIFLGFTKTRLA
eukprot:m.266865 g.266865  ORF g.266865 m.266865 type:complete len:202 (+) comp40505_c0_seq25:698-1303(+)